MSAAGDVMVVHDRRDASTALARRLAGHLRGRGLPAVAVQDRAGIGVRLRDAANVIVVAASGANWSDEVLTALGTLRCPVIVGRRNLGRLPDELHGFPVLSLVPGHSYAPTAAGGGYEHVVDILTPHRATPPSPPTAVFLSYNRKDSAFLDHVLVPLLDGASLPYFDYQYSRKLDILRLEAELEHWVAASVVVLVVATPDWRASDACALELRTARARGKPVVAVWPPTIGPSRAASCGEGVPTVSFGRDTDAAGRRLVATVRRHLPAAAGR